jgi:hypothetical protein
MKEVMPKFIKYGLWAALVVFVLIVLGAWETYDYGLNCTKCELTKHVVDERFLGIAVFRSSTSRGSDAAYRGIFGHPCEHVFRKTGFGAVLHGIPGTPCRCGVTGEGSLFQQRSRAVKATYELDKKFSNKELALESFRLIDRLMPPDTLLTDYRKIPDQSQVTLRRLWDYFFCVETVEEWREVLDCAGDGFVRKPKWYVFDASPAAKLPNAEEVKK